MSLESYIQDLRDKGLTEDEINEHLEDLEDDDENDDIEEGP